jgi:tRNA-specific 2-thiouridylase
MLLTKKDKRIFVAMSGGVDSSVSAYLLKKQGYEVYGGFIRGFNVDGCQDRDAEDAQKVANQLDIPFYVFDMEEEYRRRVVDYLIGGYAQGTTPNPDVVCNREIKFGLFYDAAASLGAGTIATGHYARMRATLLDRERALYKGIDPNKDQTYFLWDVPYERLLRTEFPIGGIPKRRVRRIAEDAGLAVAHKKDSQGICFLGKFKFSEFLAHNLSPVPGPVVDTSGAVIGEHDGVELYTIGQRHGFLNRSSRPAFVVGKDASTRTLTVAYEGDPALSSSWVRIGDLNFLSPRFHEALKRAGKAEAYARVRYRQALSRVGISREKDDILRLEFRSGGYRLFPAHGQSAVLYDKKGKVLCGGIITAAG